MEIPSTLQLLEKYCVKKNENGLLLLSMPTGSGKTHSVLDFIYKHYQDFQTQDRRIFFLTNLKKNLPHQELKKRFEKDHKGEEYTNHVLFIDSNADTVIKELLHLEPEIPDTFKGKTYKKLKSYIESLKAGKQMLKALKDTLESEVRTKLEPAFRKEISEHLKSTFKTKKERIKVIQKNKEYQWIGRLYPAVFTDEKTVIFLSVDKFIRKNTTFVEPSYYFHEKLSEKAVIFIDEFDSTKENILRHIIETGIRHKVSLLDLFLNIQNHLMQHEFPEWLLREASNREEVRKKKEWPSLQEIVKNFKDKAEKVFNDFNLQHTCKSHEEFSSNQRNFLFYDYQFHHVLDARHKRIEIFWDKENRANLIRAVCGAKQNGDKNIRSLLSEIAGFLTYFQRGISYLADNYCQLKREDSTIEEVFLLEAAVRTVLNHFRLDTDDVNFLTDNIMEGNFPYGHQPELRDVYKLGFYEAGFKYYDIVDRDEHDTLSKIYMYDFPRTPEFFLKGLCHNSLVVGLSATAGVQTNIGNYDLNYLKAQLGEKFFQIDEADIKGLRRHFEYVSKGYEEVSVKVNFLGSNNGSEKMTGKFLEKLFDDSEAANALKEKAAKATGDDNNFNYLLERYLRILSAFDYFLENGDIRAFLCLLNKLPKAGDEHLDIEILYQFSDLLIEKRGLKDNPRDLIEVLSGENFEDRKKRILEELSDGKRRFLISTYQTVGAGQNLQYQIPENFNAVHINSFPERLEMDFNGIYLDKPTNLLVNIRGEELSVESFVKYLFQLEMLAENGAISPAIFREKVDEAFHCFVGRQRFRPSVESISSLYQTDAYTRFVNRILIQAIGRICRTNMKCPNIHILTDSTLKKHLGRFSLPDDVIPVREYEALQNSAGKQLLSDDRVKEFENRASHKSNRTNAFINRQNSTPWTHESTEMWKSIRAELLKRPYLVDSVNTDSNKWLPLYVELPEKSNSYWFSQKKDYQDVTVSFSKIDGFQEVSDTTARLEELMKVLEIRKLFQNKGWATKFKTARFIATPPMFNNIYKGAIGEECGRMIFEKLLGIPLQELDLDEFELFDFKTSCDDYIDFKLWNDRFAVPAKEQLTKIKEKIERCSAKRVFIVNIVASSDTDFRPILSEDGRIFEIPFICRDGELFPEALSFLKEEIHNEY